MMRLPLPVAACRGGPVLALALAACCLIWLTHGAAGQSRPAPPAGAPAATSSGAAASAPEPPRPPVDAPPLTVVDVPAADEITVLLDGRETGVRLLGVHVPTEPAGADCAHPFLIRLLTAESVWLEYEPNGPRRDAAGRLWAYAYRVPDGLLVNLELVRQGFGRATASGDTVHGPLLRAYEERARTAKRGIWGLDGGLAAVEPASAAGPTSQPAPTPGDGPAPRAARQGASPQPRVKPAAGKGDGPGKGDGDTPTADADTTVYVTRTGQKYHRAGCPHLRGGGTPLTLREAKARGLTPCSRCKPPA